MWRSSLRRRRRHCETKSVHWCQHTRHERIVGVVLLWCSYAPVKCCWSQLLLNAGEFPTKNTHTYQDNGFGDDVVWSVDVPKRDVISVLFRRVRGCFELLSLSGLPNVDAWRLVDVTHDSSASRRYRRNWVKYLLSAPANSVAHSTSVLALR